jgi:serine/threonine protein phosphatase PrpC
VSLSTAVVATVREAAIPDPLVMLTTDGIHGTVGHGELEAIVRTNQADPQAAADALAAAAREDRDGNRDDATAVVLLRAPFPG